MRYKTPCSFPAGNPGSAMIEQRHAAGVHPAFVRPTLIAATPARGHSWWQGIRTLGWQRYPLPLARGTAYAVRETKFWAHSPFMVARGFVYSNRSRPRTRLLAQRHSARAPVGRPSGLAHGRARHQASRHERKQKGSIHQGAGLVMPRYGPGKGHRLPHMVLGVCPFKAMEVCPDLHAFALKHPDR